MTGTLVTWNRSTGRSSAHILKCTLLLKSLPRKLTKFKLASLSMSPELNNVANMCKKRTKPNKLPRTGPDSQEDVCMVQAVAGEDAIKTFVSDRGQQ